MSLLLPKQQPLCFLLRSNGYFLKLMIFEIFRFLEIFKFLEFFSNLPKKYIFFSQFFCKPVKMLALSKKLSGIARIEARWALSPFSRFSGVWNNMSSSWVPGERIWNLLRSLLFGKAKSIDDLPGPNMWPLVGSIPDLVSRGGDKSSSWFWKF